MQPYEPFYYPYSVAQPLIGPVTLPLRESISRLQKQHDYCRYLEAEAAVRQQQNLNYDNYTRSILMNEQIQNDLYKKYYQHEWDRQIVNAASSQIEYNYLRKVQQLRRQRQLLENPAILKGYATLDVMKGYRDEKMMSDDQLVNQYGSGYRAKEYRQQLKQQLGSTDSGGKSFRNNQTYQKNVLKRSRQGQSSERIKSIAQKRSLIDDQAVKRSYVDDLNKSYQVNQTLKSALKGSTEKKNRGETIDVLGKTFNDHSPIKDTYLVKPKKNEIKKISNKSINHSKQRRRQNYCSYRIDQPSGSVKDAGLQKINNRLKVSEIVYKDSKLRHKRHEMDHLFNTFQNQMKLRKEIKDKINNYPSVLKRHNIVVESR